MLRGYGLQRPVFGDPVFGVGMWGNRDRPGDKKSQATLRGCLELRPHLDERPELGPLGCFCAMHKPCSNHHVLTSLSYSAKFFFGGHLREQFGFCVSSSVEGMWGRLPAAPSPLDICSPLSRELAARCMPTF